MFSQSFSSHDQTTKGGFLIINQLIPLSAHAYGDLILCVTVSQWGRRLHSHGLCVHAQTRAHTHKTHTTLGCTLNSSHLSADSSAYLHTHTLKLHEHYCFPYKPQSSVLRPRPYAHLITAALPECSLSTLISILSEEQKRHVQRSGKIK